MTRRGLVTGVCSRTFPLAILATGVGCSSTSNKASPGADAGDDSSVSQVPEASADSGSNAPTSVSLQWSTSLYPAPSPSDGGPGYPDAGGASEAGALWDAASDAGAADALVGDDAGQAPSANNGVPDVKVCAYLFSAVKTGALPLSSSALACVMTGADGGFVFPKLPVRTNLALTFNKVGLLPVVLSIATASAPVDGRGSPVYMFTAPPPSDAGVSPVPGVTVDPQKGQIYLFAIGPSPDGGANFGGERGATVSLNPMSGKGPFYQAADGTYVPSATAFIENGAAFLNVDRNIHADLCRPDRQLPAHLDAGGALGDSPRHAGALARGGRLAGVRVGPSRRLLHEKPSDSGGRRRLARRRHRSSFFDKGRWIVVRFAAPGPSPRARPPNATAPRDGRCDGFKGPSP